MHNLAANICADVDLEYMPDITGLFALSRWKKREPESFKMNLVYAPVETHEQDNDGPAHHASNTPRKAEYGRQHQLSLDPGKRFEELTWLRQPGKQRLLERAVFQPFRQPPLILHRHSLGQLLNLADHRPSAQEKQETEAAQTN